MGNWLTVTKYEDIQVISTLLPHESAEHLLSRGVHVVRTDVTNDASVQKLKDFLQKLTGGRLDILINNAYVSKNPCANGSNN